MRSSFGKYETAYVVSFDFVSAVGFPPVTATLYALKTPLSFDENRILVSSAEKDEPLTLVVAMNCSMVYWRDGRFCAAGAAGGARSAGQRSLFMSPPGSGSCVNGGDGSCLPSSRVSPRAARACS